MNPRLILLGESAGDYAGEARRRYARGERGWKATSDGIGLIKLTERRIIIIAEDFHYAFFAVADSVISGTYVVTVPSSWPTDFSVVPPPPGGFFWPAAPEDLVVPDYSGFKLYTAGSADFYVDLSFLTPITSGHSESIQWLHVLTEILPSGNRLTCSVYRLVGYIAGQVNPLRAKMSLHSGSTLIVEADTAVQNVRVGAEDEQSAGVFFRRIKYAANTEKIIMGWQDPTTYSGGLYELLEVGGDFVANPLDLPALPDGARLRYSDTESYTARHVDNVIDMFTSERAAHYYFVIYTVDVVALFDNYPSTWPSGIIADITFAPYPDDLLVYAPTCARVEKRLKTDLSLVTTYQLTPTSIDFTLQGAPPELQVSSGGNVGWPFAKGAIGTPPDLWDSTPELTRFFPYAMDGTIGTVLVAADGTEFPILSSLITTQDFFDVPTTEGLPGAVTRRQSYLATRDPAEPYCADYLFTSMSRNLFQQAALLWLGGDPSAVAGYAWAGVDAVGLKITAAAEELTNNLPIGQQKMIKSCVGDSDTLLAQCIPYEVTDDAITGQSNNQIIISTRLVDDLPVVRLEKVAPVSQALFMFDI